MISVLNSVLNIRGKLFSIVQNTVIPAEVFVGAYCIRPGGNVARVGYCSKGASIAPLRCRYFSSELIMLNCYNQGCKQGRELI